METEEELIFHLKCQDCEEMFSLSEWPEDVFYLKKFYYNSELCSDCAYEDSLLSYHERWDLEEYYCS